MAASAWRIYDLMQIHQRHSGTEKAIRDWLGPWYVEKLEEVWASADGPRDACGHLVQTHGNDHGYCHMPADHDGAHDPKPRAEVVEAH